jgi:23S rRNA U2552 (ribose-2'-O)-methylase RlmE/FtsJ
MCQIASELHGVTSALSSSSTINNRPTVLDLCMAPGGFTAAFLKENPSAKVCGISLPVAQGGHDMLLPRWKTDPRIQVYFLDLTMLATEMGVDPTETPADHIDATNFLSDRPFHGETFDLVFCDGQVLQTQPREEYREKREAWRLLTGQLVLALQRLKQDGKLVVLLHKLDAWNTVFLLYTLSKFSSLQMFKSKKKHTLRSSFYVVAERIQIDSEHLRAAVATWKGE